MNWPLVVLAVALAQDGPIPPERVDPQSVPVPASTTPVQPSDGAKQQEAPQRQTPRTNPTGTLPRVTAPHARPAASIFTDEEYRQARVRSLLVQAMEGRV